MQAADDIGQTLTDVFNAAIIETAEQFLDEVVEALVEIGKAALDILVAVLEIAGGAIGTIIAILFELLPSRRALNADERADAVAVFGNTIDLDAVHISVESVENDIIFGVQDFFNQLFQGNFAGLTDERDSRAFVTGNLINFDTDDGTFDRPTLIHELTHVWQNQHVGPIYLAHAVAGGIVEGYNYGYTEPDVEITVPNAFHDGRSVNYQNGFITGEGGRAGLDGREWRFLRLQPRTARPDRHAVVRTCGPARPGEPGHRSLAGVHRRGARRHARPCRRVSCSSSSRANTRRSWTRCSRPTPSGGSRSNLGSTRGRSPLRRRSPRPRPATTPFCSSAAAPAPRARC